jgi:hypothetical protein
MSSGAMTMASVRRCRDLAAPLVSTTPAVLQPHLVYGGTADQYYTDYTLPGRTGDRDQRLPATTTPSPGPCVEHTLPQRMIWCNDTQAVWPGIRTAQHRPDPCRELSADMRQLSSHPVRLPMLGCRFRRPSSARRSSAWSSSPSPRSAARRPPRAAPQCRPAVGHRTAVKFAND